MINTERKCEVCGEYCQCGGVDTCDSVFVCRICSLKLSTEDLFELTSHESQAGGSETIYRADVITMLNGLYTELSVAGNSHSTFTSYYLYTLDRLHNAIVKVERMQTL